MNLDMTDSSINEYDCTLALYNSTHLTVLILGTQMYEQSHLPVWGFRLLLFSSGF